MVKTLKEIKSRKCLVRLVNDTKLSKEKHDGGQIKLHRFLILAKMFWFFKAVNWT